MNHAQDDLLNFEFLFKGSISSDAKKKQLLELLENEAAGGVGFSVPPEELFLLIVACSVGKVETRTIPSPAAKGGLEMSDPGGWIRAMEEFDRF